MPCCRSPISVTLFLALFSLFSAMAAEPFIVKDGRPRAEVVVGEDPGRMAKFAAQELRTHIQKISGAELAIVPKPTGKVPLKIYVGKNACAALPDLNAEGLEHGAFRTRSGPDYLALLGNDWEFTPIEPWPRDRGDLQRVVKEWDGVTGDTFAYPYWRLYRQYNETFDLWDFDDRGTANAVYAFLRNLGVRWYFPGELGTIIPKKTDIPLPNVDETVRADFPMRCLNVFNANVRPEVFLWKTRQGVNYPYDLLGLAQVCHGTKFITMRDEMKERHPEIYRLVNGERATGWKKGQGSPCVSSPLFYEKQREFAQAMFDHFKCPMLSLDVNDGFGPCQCELCEGTTKLDVDPEGSLSDHVWNHVNRLATELNKTHPGHGVSGLSYGAYREVPKSIDKLSPNITLMYCQHRSAFGDPEVRRKFVERRDEWRKILTSKKMFTFDFHLMSKPKSAFSGVPVYFPRQIAEDLQSLKGVSLGDFISVACFPQPDKFPWDSLAIDHLNDYVTARFWWDADQDLDKLLDEYFADLYGPAKEEMKEYVDYCSKNWMNMLSDVEPISRSLDLLERARKAAGDTIYGRRVDKIVAYTQRLNEIRDRMANKRKNIPDARALPRRPQDLTFDGRLDDPFWKQTRHPRMSELQTGGDVSAGTVVRFAWAGDSLYLGLRCQEPDMANMVVDSGKSDDPDEWTGDAIDVLIETQLHSFYLIRFNPNGDILDFDCGGGEKNAKWESNARVAVHKGEDFWSAEVRIPCAGPMAEETDPLIGIAGRVPNQTYPWFVNVCRRRVRDGRVELSAWSPTGSDCVEVPRKFGRIYIK